MDDQPSNKSQSNLVHSLPNLSNVSSITFSTMYTVWPNNESSTIPNLVLKPRPSVNEFLYLQSDTAINLIIHISQANERPPFPAREPLHKRERAEISSIVLDRHVELCCIQWELRIEVLVDRLKTTSLIIGLRGKRWQYSQLLLQFNTRVQPNTSVKFPIMICDKGEATLKVVQLREKFSSNVNALKFDRAMIFLSRSQNF